MVDDIRMQLNELRNKVRERKNPSPTTTKSFAETKRNPITTSSFYNNNEMIGQNRQRLLASDHSAGTSREGRERRDLYHFPPAKPSGESRPAAVSSSQSLSQSERPRSHHQHHFPSSSSRQQNDRSNGHQKPTKRQFRSDARDREMVDPLGFGGGGGGGGPVDESEWKRYLPLVILLLVALLGLGGYLGYAYWKKRRDEIRAKQQLTPPFSSISLNGQDMGRSSPPGPSPGLPRPPLASLAEGGQQSLPQSIGNQSSFIPPQQPTQHSVGSQHPVSEQQQGGEGAVRLSQPAPQHQPQPQHQQQPQPQHQQAPHQSQQQQPPQQSQQQPAPQHQQPLQQEQQQLQQQHHQESQHQASLTIQPLPSSERVVEIEDDSHPPLADESPIPETIQSPADEMLFLLVPAKDE